MLEGINTYIMGRLRFSNISRLDMTRQLSAVVIAVMQEPTKDLSSKVEIMTISKNCWNVGSFDCLCR